MPCLPLVARLSLEHRATLVLLSLVITIAGACSASPPTSPSPYSILTLTDLPELMTVGSAAQLTLTIKSADGSSKDVTSQAGWTSRNPDVATVLSGKVTALAEGTAAIQATYLGYTAFVSSTVK